MPPLIRRPKGIPGWQLGLAVGSGIIGGIYIWKPAFDKYWSANAEKLAEKKAKKQ